MADTTAQQAREGITAAYQNYMAELKQVESCWETKPSGGEGEDAWCARQVAEHVGGTWAFFGSAIGGLIRVPGPTPARLTLPDCAGAVGATESGHADFVKLIEQVQDQQLGLEIEHPVLGKQTTAGLLGVVAWHLNDHAGQLKTLRGG